MSIACQAANFAFRSNSWVEKGSDRLWKAQQTFLFGTLPAALQTVTSAVTVVAAGIFSVAATVGWTGAKLFRQDSAALDFKYAAKATFSTAKHHTGVAIYSAINTATLTIFGKVVKCVQSILRGSSRPQQQRQTI